VPRSRYRLFRLSFKNCQQTSRQGGPVSKSRSDGDWEDAARRLIDGDLSRSLPGNFELFRGRLRGSRTVRVTVRGTGGLCALSFSGA
jgi:hypothetical protein